MYAVYRHFDENDQLLYVGMSINPLRRLEQHKRHSGWYDEIATVKIERFAGLGEAAEAEVAAIKAEKPSRNKMHNRQKADKKTRPGMPFHRLSNADLTFRVYDYLKGYSRDEYGPESFDNFKRKNPEMVRYLDNVDPAELKPMSEQSYRNWKSKNFAGYQIPNDDDVIEANSEDET